MSRNGWKILFACVFALLATGFIGASYDAPQAQAWGRWGAGSGPARRLLGFERRQARREARHGAYSGSGSSGSYSGSGSAGASGAGSAGSHSGYSAPIPYTYGSYSNCPSGNCPTGNCGTLSRWR